ncbi:hypothetical protein BO70DRAFT_364871 [Aspergillus heteromorphus CBS 117.55]|uniref:Secreted protein n=1 Tax=Aspergillus heteromorphus CBS 117.55 TaxID=1448321 RepID=A0A317VEK7_9EURO|nr:uncharacterized protein BO70DRAFT_364871 [Aspergillus heteromorphus CBS 117.55]PWY72345.1 hypothetical protein BO70DRAFT_364871 [Aspergillus heteromorphus CBS 117.55]
MSILLYLVVMRVHLLHQARVTSSSYVGQRRVHVSHFGIHRYNRLGGTNELSISRPNKSPEPLLIACDVAAQLLLHTAHSGNWIVKSILP